MRSTPLALTLGFTFLLAISSVASAQPPSEWFYGCNNGNSFGAAITGRLHQHGPLFNYGPYYGYPPFTPYGPWNAYLQYNPWFYGYPPARGLNCSHGDLSGHGPLCPGWSPSWHSSCSHGGWYHGCSTCSYGGPFTGNDSWGRAYLTPPTNPGASGSLKDLAGPTKLSFNLETTDPVSRFSGYGNPADVAVFYAGLPTIDPNLIPASGSDK